MRSARTSATGSRPTSCAGWFVRSSDPLGRRRRSQRNPAAPRRSTLLFTLVVALLLATAGVPLDGAADTPAAPATPSTPSADQIVQYLSEVVDWYHRVTT